MTDDPTTSGDPGNPGDPITSGGAPLRIGVVALAVRDLDRVAGFYRSVLGLVDLDRNGDTLRLGLPGTPLLDLVHRPDARPAARRSAGLFHTAFLLPERRDLGRWLRHAASLGIALQGASDHGVSEAVYLADPEGNGIEVYRDRPSPLWPREDGRIAMVTKPLDVDGLLAEGADGAFDAAPAGTLIGHVHLQVGDLETAESFYRDVLGLDLAQHMPGAAFLSSGLYHHHVGANVWNSRGAPARDPNVAGLLHFELRARDRESFREVERRVLASGRTAARDETGSIRLADPWNTGLHVTLG